MSLQRVELLISGVVQGVGFRYFVYQQAQRLRLTGWVRNLPDGRVQVAAEGDRAVLDEFIAVLKPGPRFAQVHDLETTWSEATGRHTSFEVTR